MRVLQMLEDLQVMHTEETHMWEQYQTRAAEEVQMAYEEELDWVIGKLLLLNKQETQR